MTLSREYDIDIGFGRGVNRGGGGVDKNTKTKIRHIESGDLTFSLPRDKRGYLILY